jgi:hypothetical protein
MLPVSDHPSSVFLIVQFTVKPRQLYIPNSTKPNEGRLMRRARRTGRGNRGNRVFAGCGGGQDLDGYG